MYLDDSLVVFQQVLTMNWLEPHCIMYLQIDNLKIKNKKELVII